MKIAIPTKGNDIDNHFGHCDYFTIIDINDRDQVFEKELMDSTVECGCKSGLAGELAKKGVKLLLAGGIGGGAINKLREYQIEVIPGFTGTIDEVLEKWKLKEYGNEMIICTDHQHNCSH
ncbi:NifB/NifX family molybdenum-iron cluster-binding protein [Sunxiuqinia sp. A32]|uniref:NifB/NifX family molybdenum-iron cluster-binding protein n=1 Tax=Sunxiuqinia sp. A32 TaxID=3461496 RepID=UPI004045658F